MNIIRDTKISHKLVGLLVFLVIGFIGIGLTFKVYQNTGEAALDAVTDAKTYVKALDQIDIYVLQARRNEKDFLLRMKPKYLDKHNATMATIYKYIEPIERTGIKC